MIDILLCVLALIVLLIGSYTDFKFREVPDWLSYSLIFSAIGTRLLYSIYNSNYYIILNGLIGLAFMILLSNLLYYLKQWGGGDAKILMGMGAVIGLDLFSVTSYLSLGIFFLLLILSGAVYGIAFAVYLALKYKAKFKKSFKSNTSYFKYLELFAVLFLIFSIITMFVKSDFYLSFLLFGVSAILFVGIFSFIFTRAVEEGCMFQKLKASKLTEGDWVAETIKYKGKKVIDENNLGITKAQLNKLKGYRKLVLVKQGIPFIPVFLIAFVAFIWLMAVF